MDLLTGAATRTFYIIENGSPVEAQKGDTPTHALVRLVELERLRQQLDVVLWDVTD